MDQKSPISFSAGLPKAADNIRMEKEKLETPKQTTSKATPKKEKAPFKLSAMAANVLSCLWIVLFAAYAAFVLIGNNSDTMYQAQNFSFFNSTEEFFHDCMAQPGGLITWMACYLTQYFYEPMMGGSIIIALWVATYFAGKKALGISSAWAASMLIPVSVLLLSIVGIGYWLYYIKQEGYWFFGTVGFLISMLMTWGIQISKNTIFRIVYTLCVGLTYPLFGWYSLLALIYIGVVALIENIKSNNSIVNKLIVPVLSIALVGVVPFVTYNFYSNVRIEDMWVMGFPFFTNDTMVSYKPELGFIILAASPLLLAALPKTQELKGAMASFSLVFNIAVTAACAYAINSMEFKADNFHTEIRMYKAVENQDWDAVLNEMSGLKGDADRQMVLFKNIALMNKGEMGSKMFRYNNMGANPENGFDTLRIHMVQTGAPLIYMNHGKTNFSIRWCIENGVEFGTSFNNLKILALCSILNNEYDAARKYLSILQNTKYYSDWADHYMPLAKNPALISDYHEFDYIRELRNHMGSVLDGDQGLCEMYLLNYFSNTMNKDSQKLQELTLNYAMVQKDIQLFWPRFFLFATMNKGKEMPIHYQEAAFLYGNLEHEVDINSMPFDKEKVVNRYAGFQQLSQSLLASGMKTPDVGEAMKDSYGDTFWWFYFFCRDVHSY